MKFEINRQLKSHKLNNIIETIIMGRLADAKLISLRGVMCAAHCVLHFVRVFSVGKSLFQTGDCEHFLKARFML